MLERLRSPFDRLRFWVHWRRNTDLLEAGVPLALTPAPPRLGYRGERAEEFRDRIKALLRRYSSPPALIRSPDPGSCWFCGTPVDEAKDRFAKEISDAWRRGDQVKMDTLCRDYSVDVDPDDPFGTVTIKAAPAIPASERTEFTVVKAAP